MRQIKLLTTIIIVVVIFFSSCREDVVNIEDSGIPPEQIAQQPSDGAMVLGKEINDPYAIHNIKAAYSNLKSAGGEVPVAEVQPNKKYLRFLPANEDEWALLKRDSTLLLFDFPLHYEIAVSGSYYHDPELPDNAITWQYCVVPIDWPIPAVKHELLYEVFIPEEPAPDAEMSIKRASVEGGFYDELLYESYKMTGNVEEPKEGDIQTKGLFKPKRWNPQGTITVHDSKLGTIRLEGANVHARWSTHVESAITNANGYFRTGSFIYNVNYAIKWDRPDFDIRSGNFGQAWYDGPKMKGDWNLHISSGNTQWFYAHIHRGAYTYYYKNSRYGIKTPPKDGKLFKQKIHIGAMDKSGRAHYYDFNKFFLAPQIKIYSRYDTGSWRNSEDIFGTTVHEFAHASHWEIGYSYAQYAVDWIFSEPFLPESWATGVEAFITSDVYSDNWGQNQFKTLSSILGNGGYTPIVWDLMDTFNQRDKYGSAYPIDRVSGYTLNQLENALYGNYTWTAWRNAIKSRYTNSSAGFVDELFANYK